MSVQEQNQQTVFEQLFLPHLQAAYNLARWLTRNEQDAQDAVQEACLRAYRFSARFHGGAAKPWFLKIVRNTCYTWLQKNRMYKDSTEFDEALSGPDLHIPDAEKVLLRSEEKELLRLALRTLPDTFREVLILRELEEMSYREISDVIGVPAGTVMSRLSRARSALSQVIVTLTNKVAA